MSEISVSTVRVNDDMSSGTVIFRVPWILFAQALVWPLSQLDDDGPPDDVVVEQLPIVGAGDVRLRNLRAVKLEPPPNPLPQHVEGRVGLHDLGHGLLDQWLGSREPVSEGRV